MIVCLDVGSTRTKAALIDDAEDTEPHRRLVAVGQAPTTTADDVMQGVEMAVSKLGAAAQGVPRVACSSAGGGLRIAVVGNEALVSAEAGRRVALSSGGHVVLVCGIADELELAPAAPDVVLLTGGTDGGNTSPLARQTQRLIEQPWRGPIVVAGSSAGSGEAVRLLASAGFIAEVADNVIPRIGVLEPSSARAALRSMFLAHVIGGKQLSTSPSFAQMVIAPTPDVVLAGVEMIGREAGAGGVAVVDVGGATSDVYSWRNPEDNDVAFRVGELAREVVAATPANRSVEADLGMRWSAASTLHNAVEAGLSPNERVLQDRASDRVVDVGYLATAAPERDFDISLAGWAATLALRRHAGTAAVSYSPRTGRTVHRSGADLRRVDLLVASGGAFRHFGSPALRVLSQGLHQTTGFLLPRSPRVVLDSSYLLLPIGLLAATHPQVARDLAQRLLVAVE